jgi:aspartate racemase
VQKKKIFGIVGGLGTLAGGDLLLKLLKSRTVLENQHDFHFLFEQHPYQQIDSTLQNESDVSSRKFYVYEICKGFEEKEVFKVLLPCFASHTFFDQLQSELNIPIVNMLQALEEYIGKKYAKGTKVGVLTSDYVKNSGLFKSYFKEYDLLFPESQNNVMEAVYGEQGIKKGHLNGMAVQYIYQVCQELQEAGCSVILPGITELSLIAEQLWRRGIPFIDVNQVYADYAIDTEVPDRLKPFKLGILGGIGPSATVDFMTKVIKSTPAQKDQDHIKMIVEQNPQIPDRTANLLYNEPDPTIAMFATCKRLEMEGAEAIAIPCNTAHAFVDSIQQHLGIPIINMLSATVEYIVAHFGTDVTVGLAATSGTIKSLVYHDIASIHNLKMIVPDEENQEYVMQSIYGENGVKAGYSSGKCVEDITKAINHLAEQGAEVVILGCTELPIMFPDKTTISLPDGKEVSLVDPTLVLAKRCVEKALNSKAL